jgi:DNA-binding HxlR family transcriptional regulator
MARTHQNVRFLPKGKQKHTEATAAKGVEEVLRILEGRWKLVILFHLFGGKVRRFSELRRAIPAVSEKMLIQQLRQMERDGIVRRFVHHQVPPKVELQPHGLGTSAVSRPRCSLDVGRIARVAGGAPVIGRLEVSAEEANTSRSRRRLGNDQSPRGRNRGRLLR